MNRRVALIVAALVSVSGCGGYDLPTGPSALTVLDRPTTPVLTTSLTSSLMGSWAGAIIDPISGDGTLTLSFTDQTPSQVTGVWSATFRNGERLGGRASSAPVVSGQGVVMVSDTALGCNGPTLSFSLVNIAVTATELTAASWRTTCTGVNVGSVRLAKQ